MNSDVPAGRLLRSFFLLVFVLSVPLWLVGGNKLPLLVNAPVSALTTFVPAIAACILIYRRQGFNGIRVLFRRMFDYKRIRNKIWSLPTLLLAPLMYFLSYVIMCLTGAPLPERLEIPLLTIPVIFVVYIRLKPFCGLLDL